MSQTVTDEINEIEVRYVDNSDSEHVTLNSFVTDSEQLQDRVDNLYRSEFQAGLISELVAYDYDGQEVATRSADKFFGARIGF